MIYGSVDKYKSALGFTKTSVLKALKELGVDSVQVQYQGSGDSGEVYEVSILPVDKNVSTTKVKIQEAKASFIKEKDGGSSWVSEIYEDTVSLYEAINGILYSYLEMSHPGWEINEGSQGEMTIEVEGESISLVHTEFYTESNQYEYEF